MTLHVPFAANVARAVTDRLLQEFPDLDRNLVHHHVLQEIHAAEGETLWIGFDEEALRVAVMGCDELAPYAAAFIKPEQAIAVMDNLIYESKLGRLTEPALLDEALQCCGLSKASDLIQMGLDLERKISHFVVTELRVKDRTAEMLLAGLLQFPEMQGPSAGAILNHTIEWLLADTVILRSDVDGFFCLPDYAKSSEDDRDD
jgi:hypothetical protein